MEKLWQFHGIGKYEAFHGNLSYWDGTSNKSACWKNVGNYDLNLGQATVWNLSKINNANHQNFNNGDKVIGQRINKKSNNIVHNVTVE